jgi:hypothetical protein
VSVVAKNGKKILAWAILVTTGIVLVAGAVVTLLWTGQEHGWKWVFGILAFPAFIGVIGAVSWAIEQI